MDSALLDIPNLTVKDVCRMVNVGSKRVYAAIHSGSLRAVSSGRGGRWVMKVEWVKEWVDSWESESKRPAELLREVGYEEASRRN